MVRRLVRPPQRLDRHQWGILGALGTDGQQMLLDLTGVDYMSSAGLRVRAQVGSVSSPWTASGLLTIDQPTAVSLASFEAGVGRALAGWPALLLLALAGAVAGLAGWQVARRRSA